MLFQITVALLCLTSFALTSPTELLYTSSQTGTDALFNPSPTRETSNCFFSSMHLYPDPKDCQKFFRCVSGKPVAFYCPPLTAFDSETQVCSWRVRKNGCGGRMPLGTTSWKSILSRLVNSINVESSAYMSKVGIRADDVVEGERKGQDGVGEPIRVDVAKDAEGGVNNKLNALNLDMTSLEPNLPSPVAKSPTTNMHVPDTPSKLPPARASAQSLNKASKSSTTKTERVSPAEKSSSTARQSQTNPPKALSTKGKLDLIRVKSSSAATKSAFKKLNSPSITVKSSSTNEKSPSTTVNSPSTTAKSPSTAVKSPSTTAKSPSTTVKSPSATVKSPSTTTKSPSTRVKSPSSTVKSPSTTVKSTSTTAKSPSTTVKSPPTTAQSPFTTVKSPSTTVHSPSLPSKSQMRTEKSVRTEAKSPRTTDKTTGSASTSFGTTDPNPTTVDKKMTSLDVLTHKPSTSRLRMTTIYNQPEEIEAEEMSGIETEGRATAAKLSLSESRQEVKVVHHKSAGHIVEKPVNFPGTGKTIEGKKSSSDAISSTLQSPPGQTTYAGHNSSHQLTSSTRQMSSDQPTGFTRKKSPEKPTSYTTNNSPEKPTSSTRHMSTEKQTSSTRHTSSENPTSPPRSISSGQPKTPEKLSSNESPEMKPNSPDHTNSMQQSSVKQTTAAGSNATGQTTARNPKPLTLSSHGKPEAVAYRARIDSETAQSSHPRSASRKSKTAMTSPRHLPSESSESEDVEKSTQPRAQQTRESDGILSTTSSAMNGKNIGNQTSFYSHLTSQTFQESRGLKESRRSKENHETVTSRRTTNQTVAGTNGVEIATKDTEYTGMRDDETTTSTTTSTTTNNATNKTINSIINTTTSTTTNNTTSTTNTTASTVVSPRTSTPATDTSNIGSSNSSSMSHLPRDNNNNNNNKGSETKDVQINHETMSNQTEFGTSLGVKIETFRARVPRRHHKNTQISDERDERRVSNGLSQSARRKSHSKHSDRKNRKSKETKQPSREDDDSAISRHPRSSEEDSSAYPNGYDRVHGNDDDNSQENLTFDSKRRYNENGILYTNIKLDALKADSVNAVDLPNRMKTGKWYEQYTLTKQGKRWRPHHRRQWFDNHRYAPTQITDGDSSEHVSSQESGTREPETERSSTIPQRTTETLVESHNTDERLTETTTDGEISNSEERPTESDESTMESSSNSEELKKKEFERVLVTDSQTEETRVSTQSTDTVTGKTVSRSSLPDSTQPSVATESPKETLPSLSTQSTSITSTPSASTTSTPLKVVTTEGMVDGSVASDIRSSFVPMTTSWTHSNDNDMSTYTASRVSMEANAGQNLDFKLTPYMVKGLIRPFQCPSADGHFPDAHDCSVFYHCEAGVPYRRDCPSGEAFHAQVLSCVSAHLVEPCTLSETTESSDVAWQPDCQDPNGLYRDPVSCQHFYECTNGWPVRRDCMKGTVFDQLQGKCTWSQFVPGCEDIFVTENKEHIQPFLCPRDGYFRDSQRCDVYYLCAGSDSIRMTCNSGTSFDVSLNMCIWSNLVTGCESSGYAEPAFPEQSNSISDFVPNAETQHQERLVNADFVCPYPEGFYPHPEDCNMYYTCGQGVPTLMTCPYGSGYHPDVGLCLNVAQVPRCASLLLQSDQQYQLPEHSKFQFECPSEHGLYPDPGNCSVFVHCFKGKSYRHKCQDGTYYSAQVAACTWARLVPECINGNQVSRSAHGGHVVHGSDSEEVVAVPYRYEDFYPTEDYGDATDKSLDRYSDFRCDSALDGFHRDHLYCDLFHRCVMGTKFSFTCPDGTFFRLDMKICDFWDTVRDCTEDGLRYEMTRSVPEVLPDLASESRREVAPPIFQGEFAGQQPGYEVKDTSLYDFDNEPVRCPYSSGLFAHPRNCRQFLLCAQNAPVILTCPKSLLYNPRTLTCDYSTNVQCVRYDFMDA